MKKRLWMPCLLLTGMLVAQAETKLNSPDGRIAVTIDVSDDGRLLYEVSYDGTPLLLPSPLGAVTNMGDYSQGLELTEATQRQVDERYSLRNTKQSQVHYEANEATLQLSQKGQHVMDVVFRVSNRDVAFRYVFLPRRDTRVCVVEREESHFVLPGDATAFVCPQSKPMTGFARTAPSYETSYALDEPAGKNGWGEGYTFPCLFRVRSEELGVRSYWLLISETGTDGSYVGCRLLCENSNEAATPNSSLLTPNSYKIGFPQQGELNGVGSVTPAMSLPGKTPWRTITVGPLANIVETTAAQDLVEPKYKASQEYIYGKGSWSWIIGMDSSCNFDDQKRYIDFSAAMGWQSVLIDAFWDRQIGYEKMAELARYGRERGVGIFLWYNSNGAWNDAPQTPIGKMSNQRIRRQEMQWMKDNGIRGIKVDFFGGDKQPMMQLYEDILSDANDFGLLVIFHGCTLPRGWERMYPNYAASEAVLASENLHFGQGACDAEARNACIHPFIRNTVGSMDFGGSTLNKRYSADNQHGTTRRTSDVFALATAVLFQSAVQHFAMAPNNLTDAPAWAVDFMKRVPTTWDETRFIDGYPGKYIIMARRSADKWYVVGINAETEPLTRTVSLSMFEKGTELQLYADDAQLSGSVHTVKQNKKQQLKVTIPQNGGLVIMSDK